MPSPLNRGADNPRLCSAGSKAEVLANVFAYLKKSMAGEIQPESKKERMERQADALTDGEISYYTSFYPKWETIGPHLPPEHIDDRSRVRFGRYGARISD